MKLMVDGAGMYRRREGRSNMTSHTTVRRTSEAIDWELVAKIVTGRLKAIQASPNSDMLVPSITLRKCTVLPPTWLC